MPNTVIALAAEKKSPETFYLMKITEEQSKEEDHMDDYGHRMKKESNIYREYFSKESVVQTSDTS